MTGTGELTVVLPCAGRGSRLGLALPKELVPAAPGRTALDGVFALLAAHRAHLRVVIVVGDGRQATIAHVRDRYPDWVVAFVYQHPDQREMVGAVRSALAWCTDRVLVLLPDQWLSTPPGTDPVAAADTALATGPACFLAATEADPARIGGDGALRLADTGDPAGGMRVVEFADKPGAAQAGRFNAVWFGVGFTARSAQATLTQLELAADGLLTAADWRAGPLYGCPAVLVPSFTDLGTWPAFAAHWAKAGIR